MGDLLNELLEYHGFSSNISDFYEYIRGMGKEHFATLTGVIKDLNLKPTTAYEYGETLSKLGLIEKKKVRLGGFPQRKFNIYSISPLGIFIDTSDFENLIVILPNEFEYLKYIAMRGPSSAYDLSKAFNRSHGHISRKLEKLENAGYLTSRVVESEKDPWIFSLSSDGVNALKEYKTLTEKMRGAILYIQEVGKASVSDIMRECGIYKTYALRALKDFCGHGILKGERKRIGKKEFSLTEKGERTVYFWGVVFPRIERYEELMNYPKFLRLKITCELADDFSLDSEDIPSPYDRFFIGRNVEKKLLNSEERIRALDSEERIKEDVSIFSSLESEAPEYFMRLGSIIGWLEYEEDRGEFHYQIYKEIDNSIANDALQSLENVVRKYGNPKRIFSNI